ncbi:ligase-associated DNA damage response exonuclease [Rhodobaculum claviforme]|uniref:DNA ligase-associated DEXH box helicase n=1 Tax=Rhodobaculum claviforme TaxID=1549854 RepID=A0A934TNB9_9RHOB|nr:ligase-associated DNA damage response exonuclease [Rhodobaculum claviforme]MBK5928736.1 DNA ligase-associated DEXH box helicase [Rhodobaculum claviforme]
MGTPVLQLTDRGLYCAAGEFFVDPWRPVPRALITHGHADHARSGHGAYLATDIAAPVMRHRLGAITLDTIRYGEVRRIGAATVSFHPAGHVPGSAQIRVEVGGEVWVVSGDYKLGADGLSTPFEPVRCHTFISECTFGLPVYKWPDQAAVLAQITDWVAWAAEQGRTPVLGVYALGKAQRLLAGLGHLGPILTHGAVEATNAVMRDQGIALPPTIQVQRGLDLKPHRGRLVLAPPAALGTPWMRKLGPVSVGFASGWMRLRGVRRRRAADRGFVISDHADWDGLNAAIAATGAERVLVTHGYTTVFARWLAERGYDAGVLATEYVGEDADDSAPESGGESGGEGPGDGATSAGGPGTPDAAAEVEDDTPSAARGAAP